MTFFSVRSRTALAASLDGTSTRRAQSDAHFNMRRWMTGLAASGAASLLTGFAGVALGLPEWVFMGFVAIAFACAGLALLFVEHLTVAREEREKIEAPEIVFRPSRSRRGGFVV